MPPDSKFARHCDAFNKLNQLGSAHLCVISYLRFEPPRPSSEAAHRSREWAKMMCPTVQTVHDYEKAIADMLCRDLLWEIDTAKQASIMEFLESDPALGPTDGIPEVGTLQYSVRFAKLLDGFWADTKRERPGVTWCRDWQSERLNLIYSPTRQQCLEGLRDELADSDDDSYIIERVSGPDPCGPWRAQWWHKYESGFVVKVNYL